ncbi:WecB/TagA/CpsF family glycosyltransferase [Halomonas denitrificans]|uniref:WecB/TagA/CpsF family glycosyltransferase n=1 Tax=Halomonas TaxID=2745 RepID=UPI001C9865B7|nr:MULTISPECIES: WecB/TagA/CpsF family glycosyltransferase [Halomonas]MBY5928196.1 WecB/TagA/CpsF family glycosyltransferase [Halomonas sp. DP8Y7-3]MCA0974767.1 WecB/TagA/CpsF family glycosyltransferase [Halomonas denitrificans]
MSLLTDTIRHLDIRTAHTGVDDFACPTPEAPATTTLFGLPLVNATRAQVVSRIIALATQPSRAIVNFVNAHCVNVARADAQYRAHLQQSDLLLPDGAGIRMASRLTGASLGDNLNGTDLFPLLCEQAAKHGLPIYLLGGRPGTARRAAEEMQRRHPGLIIAGTQHGYFGASETSCVLDQINSARPALLFVGFGVPLQEQWIAKHRATLAVPVALGVGGLFDYFAGNVSRAPVLFRRLGCEWTWRLAQEPRRLARRYLLGNVAFIAHAISQGLAAHRPTHVVHAAGKRVLDIAISGSALLLLSPLLALIAMAIRGEDGGPALFTQQRIGAQGKPFTMLKFRSMVLDAEARRAELLTKSERDGVCFKMKRDPRITRIGAWLRKTSLDELPQLVNVLRGDMSLVGPRPALPDEVVTYAGSSWQRLAGKPGITCTWQVSGRADIPFERQVTMDIEYLGRKSLFHDLALMLRTIPAVLTSRGAY